MSFAKLDCVRTAIQLTMEIANLPIHLPHDNRREHSVNCNDLAAKVQKAYNILQQIRLKADLPQSQLCTVYKITKIL